MSKDLKEIIKEAQAGNNYSLAQLISVVENGGEKSQAVLAELSSSIKPTITLGVTGSPGSGKSTLVDCLASLLSEKGKRVAVLAVDPSSPFTGGAVLGDRIRMQHSSDDDNIYIRSLSVRGALGGVSSKTNHVVYGLSALGFDYILIETVGVGQAETEILKTADCVSVVLVPGMGDTVQTLKAGILEIADCFVINKADFKDAPRLKAELTSMLSLSSNHEGLDPSIVETIATEKKGIDQWLSNIEDYLNSAGDVLAEKKRRFFTALLEQSIKDAIESDIVSEKRKSGDFSLLLEKLEKGELDPVTAAKKLLGS